MNHNRHYALILGASSGFGKAAALALADEGMNIIGVHLDRAAGIKAVEELKRELQAKGVQAIFFNVNAADADRRREVVESVKDHFAQHEGATIRLLMHSLAFGSLLPVISQTEQMLTQRQVEMTLDVMANSLLYWTQSIVTEKLMEKGGRIVGMTSAGSTRVLPTYGAVSAAKAAMEAYIRQLALELAPYGITANAIRAGVTQTPALSKIPGNELIMNNAHMRNPYHRLTVPEDIANVLKMLVKDEMQWINGTVLGVDGGEDSVDLTWYKAQEENAIH